MIAESHVTRIDAVVVAYQPEVDILSELLSRLSGEVTHIHLVDNTPAADARVEALLAGSRFTGVTLIRLGDNLGIAKALNVGIASARAVGASHVLFSDQDSVPVPGMVSGLIASYVALAARGEKIGAVGPTFTDEYTGITFPFQARVPGKVFYSHISADAGNLDVEALSLITSGTLVPMKVLDEVGGMRDDLFIDKVDIEWCHRARSRGWKVFGTARAFMSHRMGDEVLRVWYLRWRRESAYSPLRLYYQTRNYVALCKTPGIELRWKIRNAWYTFGVVYGQVVFGQNRAPAIKMAIRGLRDGVLGRMGPYRPS